MANVFDYLQWRGDLSLKQSGFNAVDGLILSILSYIPFDGIISSQVEKNNVTIAEAAARFFKLDTTKLPVRAEEDVQLFSALAGSERYGGMRLTGYVNKTDLEAEKQFSAITILTEDGHPFISFRGTDNSLVGWKEDFNMSFLTPVPSQKEAAAYLENTAKHIQGKLRLGGHSKGGNLAVYAAAFCKKSVQNRITSVYNNDGPGFDAKVLSQKGYLDIQDKIYEFIPQSSIIGMLLEHNEQYTVIHSSQIGLLQHDPYSWSIQGKDFIRMKSVTNSSLFIDRTLKEWVGGMQPSQREQFIDALYEIITAIGSSNLSEFSAEWLKNAKALSRSLKNIDKSTRKVLLETLVLLFRAAKKNLPPLIPSTDQIIRKILAKIHHSSAGFKNEICCSRNWINPADAGFIVQLDLLFSAV